MNQSKELHPKKEEIIITLYSEFLNNREFFENKLDIPILRQDHDETSITPENMGHYFDMLRNLINNIWKDVLEGLGITIDMPHVTMLSDKVIRESLNDTIFDELSVAYHAPSNIIIVSDKFLKRLNTFLPIITRDICIAMMIAHEFGHALANQLSGHYLGGKSTENFCDMIAGFTLQQMEKMELLGETDLETSRKMFHRLGVGQEKSHGGPQERLDAFLSGYRGDIQTMRNFLKRLMPSSKLKEETIRIITSILKNNSFKKFR